MAVAKRIYVDEQSEALRLAPSGLFRVLRRSKEDKRALLGVLKLGRLLFFEFFVEKSEIFDEKVKNGPFLAIKTQKWAILWKKV